MVGKPLPGVEYENAFPTTITAGEVTITINADGSWEGDGKAFIAELKRAKAGPYVAPNTRAVAWLVAAAIRKDL